MDDEDDVRRVTRSYLERSGYEVLEAASSVSAMRAVDNHEADVVVLDLGLAGEDGLDFLRAVRRKSDLPIVVVTARGEEADRVVGLELGADDYLVKPFSLRELTARIAAVLRRRRPEEPRVLRFGAVAIDTVAHEVCIAGQPVELTRLEYELLLFLARSPRHTFSYEQILAAVWESSSGFQGRGTVSEHVHRLRRKLPADHGAPRISTIRGVGYRLDP